jgi:hypothetical protein
MNCLSDLKLQFLYFSDISGLPFRDLPESRNESRPRLDRRRPREALQTNGEAKERKEKATCRSQREPLLRQQLPIGRKLPRQNSRVGERLRRQRLRRPFRFKLHSCQLQRCQRGEVSAWRTTNSSVGNDLLRLERLRQFSSSRRNFSTLLVFASVSASDQLRANFHHVPRPDNLSRQPSVCRPLVGSKFCFVLSPGTTSSGSATIFLCSSGAAVSDDSSVRLKLFPAPNRDGSGS